SIGDGSPGIPNRESPFFSVTCSHGMALVVKEWRGRPRQSGPHHHPGDSVMKTTIQKTLKRGTGLALLIATCIALSSCIIVSPHRHHRYPYRGVSYSQEVRP